VIHCCLANQCRGRQRGETETCPEIWAGLVGDNRELRNSMTFDACALRKMSRSGASCRKMWVAAPQQVTWVRQGHTTGLPGEPANGSFPFNQCSSGPVTCGSTRSGCRIGIRIGSMAVGSAIVNLSLLWAGRQAPGPRDRRRRGCHFASSALRFVLDARGLAAVAFVAIR
jgi:hypothetical protein